MHSYAPPRSSAALFRGLVLVAVLALIGAISVLAAPRALAHDVLLETTPTDGAELQEPPQQVALTFSGELVEMNPVIIVSDAEGQVIADDPPTLDARTATLPLPSLTEGDYQVDWSVVSSDGHRIEGAYAFSVDTAPQPGTGSPEVVEGEAGPQAEDASQAPTQSPSEQASTSAADTNTAEAPEPAGPSGLPTWLVVVLAAAVLSAVIIPLTLRRRRKS